MAYNTCTIPPKQTLFLGCSIASFSVSVGWNQQVGELTVELVQDTCASPVGTYKVYWDSDLEEQQWTDADPGFIEPNIGAPVYFRVGEFEWCGIVQSFEERNGTSGRPIYTVKLVDPRQILEGATLIIGNYAGSIYGVSNLINVFGYMETFGVTAPFIEDIYGVDFGAPSEKFGGSQANSNGMPWYLIQSSLSVLTAATSPLTNSYSVGRLEFRDGYGIHPVSGQSSTVGFGIIPGDGGVSKYLIDLSGMPSASPYWKIAGTSVSLLNAITDICERASCDYYIELVPVWYNSVLYKCIKVRTVSRLLSQPLDAVSDFITNVGATGVISYSVGKELRTEPVASFAVGGNQQGVYQVWQEGSNHDSYDLIKPYFGLDPLTNNAIIPYGYYDNVVSGYRWKFTVSTDSINTRLQFPLISGTMGITESELISALAGMDTWEADAELNGYDSVSLLNSTTSGVYNLYYIENASARHPSIKFPGLDVVRLVNDAVPKLDDYIDKGRNTLYEYILSFAEEFYGSKYMVSLPYLGTYQDPESNQVLVTDQPIDAAWPGTDQVLRLPHPSVELDFFSVDDGRIAPISCLPVPVVVTTGEDIAGIDFGSMSQDNFLITSDATGTLNLYVKTTVEPDVVYYDYANRTYPQAVIQLADKLVINTQLPGQGLNDVVGATGVDSINRASKTVGGTVIWENRPAPCAMPSAVAIPIKSNIQTYGPWYTTVGATKGPVVFNQDDGLVPWEYNGTDTMNLAGNARVYEGVGASMQVSELGSITIPGYPTIPLGAELGAYHAGIFGGGQHLVESRTASTGNGGFLYVPQTGSSGIYGPNITNIDVRVGIGGIETSYGFRTFTPAYGFFSRFNAERIKEQAQKTLQAQKQGRELQQKLARLAVSRANQGALAKASTARESVKHLGKTRVTNTPHSILVGQNLAWTSGEDGTFTSRSLCTTQSVTDAIKELRDDFNEKAFMSMEGMFRPVSMFGGGGLPRFGIPTTGIHNSGQYNGPVGTMPPLLMPTGLPEVVSGNKISGYSLIINNSYLNPLMSYVTHSGQMYGQASGHDIAILGFGDSPPSGAGSMNLYVRGTGTPIYENDYRFLALRGPLMIQGWGFDTDGKPIPNKVDIEVDASGGKFVATGLKDVFMDNWLSKSYTWPVGPVDLRWDRYRAVWTVPQYRMVFGEVIGTYGSGANSGEYKCNLLFGDNLSGPSGTRLNVGSGAIDGNTSLVDVPTFPLKNRFNTGYGSGSFVMGYYDPQQNEYFGIIPQRTFIGTLAQNLAMSGNALAHVWRFSGENKQLVNTYEEIRVYDWLLKANQTINSGTRIIAYYDAASHVAILQEARCP